MFWSLFLTFLITTYTQVVFLLLLLLHFFSITPHLILCKCFFPPLGCSGWERMSVISSQTEVALLHFVTSRQPRIWVNLSLSLFIVLLSFSGPQLWLNPKGIYHEKLLPLAFPKSSALVITKVPFLGSLQWHYLVCYFGCLGNNLWTLLGSSVIRSGEEE